MLLSQESTTTLKNGRFEGNEAGGGGGVAVVEADADLLVEGGEYSDNEAEVTGGVSP